MRVKQDSGYHEPSGTQQMIQRDAAPAYDQFGPERLLANVRQECHVPCSLDRLGDRMLTDGRAPCLATTNDFAMAIDQFLQQFNVLVVDIHWPRPRAIHVNRIFFRGPYLSRGSFAVSGSRSSECHTIPIEKFVSLKGGVTAPYSTSCHRGNKPSPAGRG